MGANDAMEMLEVAKAECLRLEQALAAAASVEAAIRQVHAVEQFGDCVEDGQQFPCRTLQILDIAAARLKADGNPVLALHDARVRIAFAHHLADAAVATPVDEPFPAWLRGAAVNEADLAGIEYLGPVS